MTRENSSSVYLSGYVVVASLGGGAGHQGEAGREKKRRKHFCLLVSTRVRRQAAMEVSTKVRLRYQDRGRQTRGLYSLVLRPCSRLGLFMHRQWGGTVRTMVCQL